MDDTSTAFGDKLLFYKLNLGSSVTISNINHAMTLKFQVSIHSKNRIFARQKNTGEPGPNIWPADRPDSRRDSPQRRPLQCQPRGQSVIYRPCGHRRQAGVLPEVSETVV